MDTYDFLADPRALPLAERVDLARLHATEQRLWLARLAVLAEPPVHDPQFPAFLLALPPFAELGARLQSATKRSDLNTATSDELDWFARAFANYLRTDCDEWMFTDLQRRAC